MGVPASDNWRRVEALFYRALEHPRADRKSFLDQACGTDASLRSEVEALLDFSEKSLGFLQKPVEEAARRFETNDITTGRQIGAYRLQRVLGEGGMGRVYLAARADDMFRQQVAIKVMHAGFGHSPRMLLRFGAERQILADLNHPNIARLLDGGIDDGLPYLVMEYVNGVSIDDYCRKNQLNVEARLSLFITVCGAVEYAHKNLVVHRDIKPGNILVTAEGVPKLLDFGIAKLLAPDGQEATQTLTSDRMMTRDYASPEQVRGATITTSTDVYALGVLLYELLSGKRPFRLEATSPLEAARAICEQIPTAPSVVSKVHPGLGPPDAARKLGGDLDNIVLMAMRKEAARRYVSVGQLAEDIERFLLGYPVKARTDAWAYRSRKFIHRHRAGFAATLVIAVSLVAFSIGMGLMARRANRERRNAEREAQFLNSIFQSTTPDQARGKQITGRELLDDGARRVDTEFAGEPELQARLLDNIGRAYTSIGDYKTAEKLLQRAYDLRQQTLGDSNLDTASTLDALATSIRLESDFKRADPLFRKALATRRARLKANDELVGQSMSNLGECLYWEDQNQEAESWLRQSLAIERTHGLTADVNSSDNYLALVLERKGEYSEATVLLREALAVAERINGVESTDYANSLHNLAGVLIDAGDLSVAEEMDKRSLAIRRKISGPGHPDLSYPLNNLGFIFLEKGDWAQAEPYLKENFEIRRTLGKSSRLAGALNNWARMLDEKGDYKASADSFSQAASMMRDVSGPRSWYLARILANFGLLRADERKFAEAEDLERQALNMQVALGGPESPDLAASQMNLAAVLSMQHNSAAAEPLLNRTIATRKKELAAGHPAIISAEIRLGEVLIDEGKYRDAEELLRHAVSETRAVPFALPAWYSAQGEIALGAALAAEGHTSEAGSLLRDPESRMKGYPEAAMLRLILQRARRFAAKP